MSAEHVSRQERRAALLQCIRATGCSSNSILLNDMAAVEFGERRNLNQTESDLHALSHRGYVRLTTVGRIKLVELTELGLMTELAIRGRCEGKDLQALLVDDWRATA